MTNSELKQVAEELVGSEELARRFRVWITGLIKKERIKRAESTPDAFFLNEAILILNDLNERTGRHYTLNPETKQMIRARMGEGHGVQDFARVHEVMCSKWLGDSKMTDYVRPSTLYRPTHFGEYLALWEPKKVSGVRCQVSVDNTEEKQREQRKAEDVLIAKLMAKAWWEFETWAEFMRWTYQFPSAESLAAYPMPERIRKMRTIPRMMINVAKNNVQPETEGEYQRIRRDILNTEKSREILTKSKRGKEGKREMKKGLGEVVPGIRMRKADMCDKCGVQLNFAGYVLKTLNEAVGNPRREISATVFCPACGAENKRRVDISREPKLHFNKE